MTKDNKMIDLGTLDMPSNVWIIYYNRKFRHFEFGNEILNDEEMLENVYEQFCK